MKKTNTMTVCPANSDQPGHPPSLIRVFAVRSIGSSGPKLSPWGQRRLWSDWADAQADLSLRWAQISFWWFCYEAAHLNTTVMIQSFLDRQIWTISVHQDQTAHEKGQFDKGLHCLPLHYHLLDALLYDKTLIVKIFFGNYSNFFESLIFKIFLR